MNWERVSTDRVPVLSVPEELLAASRSPFVGRADELTATVGLALSSDAAEVVWVLGEPGIGKTRFAAESRGTQSVATGRSCSTGGATR